MMMMMMIMITFITIHLITFPCEFSFRDLGKSPMLKLRSVFKVPGLNCDTKEKLYLSLLSSQNLAKTRNRVGA